MLLCACVLTPARKSWARPCSRSSLAATRTWPSLAVLSLCMCNKYFAMPGGSARGGTCRGAAQDTAASPSGGPGERDRPPVARKLAGCRTGPGNAGWSGRCGALPPQAGGQEQRNTPRGCRTGGNTGGPKPPGPLPAPHGATAQLEVPIIKRPLVPGGSPPVRKGTCLGA